MIQDMDVNIFLLFKIPSNNKHSLLC
jgi:hypothetical protein